jgi:NDP-sugar pyrophosphorylase family protein
MALIEGRPFIDYQLDWLRSAGIRDVVLCTGHEARTVREHCGNGMGHGLLLRYSTEEEPLGTAGALKHAERYIRRSPFLLLNGHSIFDFDLGGMVFDHWSHEASATMALARPQEASRHGRVWLDPEERITRFGEKQPAADPVASAVSTAACWVSAGVYLFSRNIFSQIPEVARNLSLEQDVLPQMVGGSLYGFRSNGYFIDVGVPEDFARAQKELPERFSCVHQNLR